jgi:hypothetical protein
VHLAAPARSVASYAADTGSAAVISAVVTERSITAQEPSSKAGRDSTRTARRVIGSSSGSSDGSSIDAYRHTAIHATSIHANTSEAAASSI